jgi:hypothetical protein
MLTPNGFSCATGHDQLVWGGKVRCISEWQKEIKIVVIPKVQLGSAEIKIDLNRLQANFENFELFVFVPR